MLLKSMAAALKLTLESMPKVTDREFAILTLITKSVSGIAMV